MDKTEKEEMISALTMAKVTLGLVLDKTQENGQVINLKLRKQGLREILSEIDKALGK